MPSCLPAGHFNSGGVAVIFQINANTFLSKVVGNNISIQHDGGSVGVSESPKQDHELCKEKRTESESVCLNRPKGPN